MDGFQEGEGVGGCPRHVYALGAGVDCGEMSLDVAKAGLAYLILPFQRLPKSLVEI